MRRTRLLAGALAASLVLLAACGYDATTVPKAKPSASSSSGGATTDPVECSNATESYRPSTDRGAAVRELKDRNLLVVGVSADTLKLGSANPFNKFAIEGFDIDVAKAIAASLGVNLRLRVITAADRIKLLKSGEIDVVVRNMTMNCARWEEIGFSEVYYNAAQKVLVRADDVAAFEKSGVKSLAEKKVCAPNGSTSLDNIKTIESTAIAVGAANHTGCLVLFQQGAVDAITGDDTVLAGLAAQDPYAKVPDQDGLSQEPYGVGVAKENVDLIRYINSVLDQRRSDGDWQSSYDTWLKPYLKDKNPPPAPTKFRG